MKTVLILAVVFVVFSFAQRLLADETLKPEDAARRVAAGTAILIDVREPDEWRGGVVAGALLLPLSDLRGDRAKWSPILKANRNKELILYCRSGNRSGIAARLLSSEGFRTANAGGFASWKNAGQPVADPP